MSLDLFTPTFPAQRLHPIFQLLAHPDNRPERDVVSAWVQGFVDRDGKFVDELQLTFEPSFWELYLYAYLRELGCAIDFGFSAPDFVVTTPLPFIMEATIAGPAQGAPPPYGWTAADIPEDLTDFNIEATLRLCNSFQSKYKKYTDAYRLRPEFAELPYVIGIGAYDRPMAHMSAGRPILAALYGLYHDEQLTPADAAKVVQYNVGAAPKGTGRSVPLGLFCDDTYSEVSAVVYSSLATWGKLRALAVRAGAEMVFSTLHPNSGSLLPNLRTAPKDDYKEHLLDGMFVLHNPFAKRPIPPGVLSHPRVAEIRVKPDGELEETYPDDFLLFRFVQTVVQNGSTLPQKLAPRPR